MKVAPILSAGVRPKALLALLAVAGLAAGASGAPPVYSTVKLSGQQAPGSAPGVVFEFLSGPRVDDSGRIVFWARLGGPGANDPKVGSVWSFSGGVLTRLVKDLDTTPFDPEQIFTSVGDPILSRSGHVVFTGTFGATPLPPANLPIRAGFFGVEEGGLADLAVRDGLAAPELPFSPNAVEGVTTAAIASATGVLALTTNGGWAAWRAAEGARELLALRNDQGPGQPEGLRIRFVDPPAVDGAGGIMFRAVLQVDGTNPPIVPALYTHRKGVLAPYFTANNPAPGAGEGVTFADFGPNPVLMANGRAFFSAKIQGPDVTPETDRGIWTDRSGAVELLVRKGDDAPGLDGGAVFSAIAARPAVSSSGDMAMLAHLAGTEVSASDNSGIWLYPAGGAGGGVLIAREGDQVPGMGEGVRFAVLQAPAINDRGQLAFLARLRGDEGAGVGPANNYALFTTNRCGEIIPVARTGSPFTVISGSGDPVVKTIAEIVYDTEPAASGRGQFNTAGTLVFTLAFTDRTSGLFSATTYLAADINRDGFVNSTDISAFITLWLADIANGTLHADFSGDGVVNSEDISAFVTRWLSTVAGGC